jgi:hypothetical protein
LRSLHAPVARTAREAYARLPMKLPVLALCSALAACGSIQRYPTVENDAGVDARSGGRPDVASSRDAVYDAPVDAGPPSCTSLAQQICALIAACPDGGGFGGYCFQVYPVTMCFPSLVNCQAAFEACDPGPTKPGQLNVIPDPGACLEGLSTTACRMQGMDYEITLPASCAVCAPPYTSDDPCPPSPVGG